MFRAGLSIIIVIGMSAQPAHSLTCREIYSSVRTRVQQPLARFERFNPENFRESRDGFRTQIQNGQTPRTSTNASPAERLALLEAVARERGVSIFSVEQIISDGTPLQRARLRSLARDLNVSEGMSRVKAERVLEELYLLTHVRALGPRDQAFWLNLAPNHVLRAEIRKRAQASIARNSLAEALADLGLLRDQGMREQIARFRANHQNIESAAISMVINTLSVHYLGMLAHLPRANIQHRPLPRDLAQRIREGGFDSVYAEIRPYFQNSVVFNRAWNTARVAYIAYFVAYAGVMAVTLAPMLATLIGYSQLTDEDLSQLQAQTFNADEVKRAQFESWRQSFYDFEGRWPDPQRDREEWDRNYNAIMNTRAEDLQVAY